MHLRLRCRFFSSLSSRGFEGAAPAVCTERSYVGGELSGRRGGLRRNVRVNTWRRKTCGCSPAGESGSATRREPTRRAALARGFTSAVPHCSLQGKKPGGAIPSPVLASLAHPLIQPFPPRSSPLPISPPTPPPSPTPRSAPSPASPLPSPPPPSSWSTGSPVGGSCCCRPEGALACC